MISKKLECFQNDKYDMDDSGITKSLHFEILKDFIFYFQYELN